MEYTNKQIENAKKAHNDFAQYRTLESFYPENIEYAAAEQRCETHNAIVKAILSGEKDVIREWKTFFLNEEVKADRKSSESKAELQSNKDASSDILEPIKALKKIGEFGKWLNNASNPFRKEHFSKQYSIDSVNAFLQTL